MKTPENCSTVKQQMAKGLFCETSLKRVIFVCVGRARTCGSRRPSHCLRTCPRPRPPPRPTGPGLRLSSQMRDFTDHWSSICRTNCNSSCDYCNRAREWIQASGVRALLTPHTKQLTHECVCVCAHGHTHTNTHPYCHTHTHLHTKNTRTHTTKTSTHPHKSIKVVRALTSWCAKYDPKSWCGGCDPTSWYGESVPTSWCSESGPTSWCGESGPTS